MRTEESRWSWDIWGNDGWRDMSEYVVHFVRGNPANGGTGYSPMMRILASRHIEARNPFGAARNLEERLEVTQRSACFSETPLDLLERLTDRRGTKYGIGFHQRFIIDSGGGRVWYLDRNSEPQRAMEDRIRRSLDGGIDQDDPLWQLTRYVDYPTDGPRRYRFEWEREWRVPGGLRFDQADVAFLFIPEDLHDAARDFFTDAQAEHFGPAYFCPYLDPDWGDDRIQQAIAELPDPPAGPAWGASVPEPDS